YFIEGNTASSTQFYVTDSVKHFLRGALYFKQHPDKDSLAPVIHYLRQDIVNLMETVRFK
ncbi:MAG: gliding motility lipoprotein GldD, partial [Odoribacter sp.]|nr:gliding motility lipoprotein GldD [Odoribacter sp.]